MKNQLKRMIIVLGITILIIAFYVLIFRGGGKEASADMTNLAACLASKNITMYGADWCPHCQNEKKAFGSAWSKVPYVECPENTRLCLEKKINSYPTWIWPDGKRLEGEQGIEKLSKESGCPLVGSE